MRPYIGDLALAQDSADAVYKLALGTLGIKTEGVHPSAWPTILEMQPKPDARKKPTTHAMDAASAASFATMFPDASRITNLG